MPLSFSDPEVPSAPTDPTVDAVPRLHDSPNEEVQHLRPGDVLGRYSILRRLGSGGMGVVYGAYDPKLDRRVAIKVLRPDLFDGGTAGATGLLHEAQAMAKLKHPNVAAVHDVGETDGHVFIAMEFIAGRTLRAWLRAEPRSWQEIVRTFVAAGRGLAAAHAAGIVHRDFKPDNVMVETERGAGDRVVVMDFGLAHAVTVDSTAEQRSDSGEASSLLGPMVGTPAYMPPEQIAGLPTDPRSDQFSFCVSLWEGLFQSSPFGGVTLAQIVAALEEHEFAPVRNDSGVPRSIRRVLERGLEKAPEERWPSMEALLGQLRYGPPDRRWIFLAAAVGGIGTAAAAFAWTGREPCRDAADRLDAVWGNARRGEVERAVLGADVRYAADTWERVANRVDAYAAEWIRSRTEACEATRVHASQSEAMMDRRMACLDRARQQLDAAARTLAAGQPSVVEHAHRLVSRLPRLQRCSDAAALQEGVAPPDPEDARAVGEIRAMLAESGAALVARDLAVAEAAVERAEVAVELLHYAPATIDVMLARAEVDKGRSKYAEAGAAFDRAREAAAAAGDRDALLRATHGRISALGYYERKTAQARPMLAVARGLADSDPIRRTDLDLLDARMKMVDGETAAAEVGYRDALDRYRELLDPDDFKVLDVEMDLVEVLFLAAKWRDVAPAAERAVERGRVILGSKHPLLARPLAYAAAAKAELRELESAEAAAREALDVLEGRGPQQDHTAGWVREILAATLVYQDRWLEAAEVYEDAIAIYTETVGAKHPYVAVATSNHAKALAQLGRHDDAIAAADRALEIWLAVQPESHPNAVDLHQDRAEVLALAGRHAEAEQALVRAWQVKPDTLAPHEVGMTAMALAELLAEDPSRRADLQTWVDRAAEAFTEAGEQFTDEADRVRSLLD